MDEETFTVEDFKKLKEEMYKIKSDHSIAINKLQSFLEDQINEKLDNVSQDFNTVNFKLLDIQSALVADKHNIEKIPELLKAGKANDDEQFTLNIKVSNIQKDLSVFIQKYDKIFLENLELPGFIGEKYKFANLREYLDVS